MACLAALLAARGSAVGHAAARTAAARTVWLCRPGLKNNPCTSDLATTVVQADGSTRVERARPAADPPVDCFYVYPTVSMQQGTNANLAIDPEERAVAIAQASRFSQVCRVYAPMYPQLTIAAIDRPGGISLIGAATAYLGVALAFQDYLQHDNHGRGIVFIGHSQGAFMLDALLQRQVDAQPAVRRRLVSALLLGGNVTVPVGRDVGGDFRHIPACRSDTQTGCVVGYSSFDRTPPQNSEFGRVGSPLNPFAPRPSSVPLQILCVNPAAPAGGSGVLEPYFPAKSVARLGSGRASASVSTPWVTYPDLYSARCESSGGATWLQVDRLGGSSDHRPVVGQTLGPTWGLHLVDVNIALGNLVSLVREEAIAYGKR